MSLKIKNGKSNFEYSYKDFSRNFSENTKSEIGRSEWNTLKTFCRWCIVQMLKYDITELSTSINFFNSLVAAAYIAAKNAKIVQNSEKNKFSRQYIMILKHLKDLNKDYFATSSSINYKDMPSTKVNDFFWFLEIVLFFIAQINMLLLLCVRLLVGEKEEYNLQPKLLMRWWDSNLCIQIIFSEKWSTLSLWIYLFSCLNLCKTLCGVKYKKTSHLIIW